MKRIELPCYGIVLEIENGGGWIQSSDLHENCQYCHEATCTCDLANDNDRKSLALYNAAMDAIESIILAHAIAGIDIESPAYIEGVETAIHGCADNL